MDEGLSPATEIFDRVLKREPRNAEAMVGKAYVEMWQRHYPAAEELWRKLRRFRPTMSTSRWRSPALCHYQNRERAAKDHVARAIKLDPNNSEAKDLKGEIDPPRPVEVRFGFEQDRFSFTDPGNMGFVERRLQRRGIIT